MQLSKLVELSGHWKLRRNGESQAEKDDGIEAMNSTFGASAMV